jgi:hypothetical protein
MSKMISIPDQSESHLVAFQEKFIRRAWHNEEWWFSIIDVVGILSETAIPKRYWSDLKRKLAQEAGSEQPYEKIVQLKLIAPDGKRKGNYPLVRAVKRVIKTITIVQLLH